MKKLFLLTVLICTAAFLNAQEVVATAGETQSVSGFEISWTLGEPVIQTFSTGSNQLTQGFHQTNLQVTPVSELLLPNFELNVFPNPTSELLFIRMNEMPSSPGFALFDLSGKLISQKKIESTNTQVNLKKFAAGTYFLKIIQNKNQTVQTFKIIKK